VVGDELARVLDSQKAGPAPCPSLARAGRPSQEDL
jgi:hypothetical protein